MDSLDMNILENFLIANGNQKNKIENDLDLSLKQEYKIINKKKVMSLHECNKDFEGIPPKFDEDMEKKRKFNFNPKYKKSIKNAKIRKKTQNLRCGILNCNKQYTSLSKLNIHKRTHIGLKPYHCVHCNKSFNEKGNLKIHMRIHTGERPYHCTFENCKKEFKAYGHLSDHLLSHYNIKPFQCLICKAKFSRSNTLKTHQLIHSGEKPFHCPYVGCNKRFTEKGNMKTHLNTHLKKKINRNQNYIINHDHLSIMKPNINLYSIINCESFSLLKNKVDKPSSSNISNKSITKNSGIIHSYGLIGKLSYPQSNEIKDIIDYSLIQKFFEDNSYFLFSD